MDQLEFIGSAGAGDIEQSSFFSWIVGARVRERPIPDIGHDHEAPFLALGFVNGRQADPAICGDRNRILVFNGIGKGFPIDTTGLIQQRNRIDVFAYFPDPFGGRFKKAECWSYDDFEHSGESISRRDVRTGNGAEFGEKPLDPDRVAVFEQSDCCRD